MVSEKNLSKLKVIIKEEYGRDLSNEETSELGNGLVNYFKAKAFKNSSIISK